MPGRVLLGDAPSPIQTDEETRLGECGGRLGDGSRGPPSMDPTVREGRVLSTCPSPAQSRSVIDSRWSCGSIACVYRMRLYWGPNPCPHPDTRYGRGTSGRLSGVLNPVQWTGESSRKTEPLVSVEHVDTVLPS